jgi:hypothetical protein
MRCSREWVIEKETRWPIQINLFYSPHLTLKASTLFWTLNVKQPRLSKKQSNVSFFFKKKK